MTSGSLQQALAEQLQNEKRLPPTEKWNPPLCGDMDLVISREGQWVHQGSQIQRKELIKLFASVLKREADEYFLVTPVEKWRIEVEDAPFYITQVERLEEQQTLAFYSSTGDTVIAGPDNPLWVESDPSTAEPNPYILVRNNLHGLLSRPVFYQLAEWSQLSTINGSDCYTVESMGQKFALE